MLQKKRAKLVIMLSVCALLFSACGNLVEMETDTSYVESESMYGNSYTNIRNDGAAYIDENGRVVYFAKADNKTIVGNVKDEKSQVVELVHDEVAQVQAYYINVIGDRMYAYIRFVGSDWFGNIKGYLGGGLVVYDLTTTQDELDWYSTEIIREGVILDLQVIDGICYFTDAATKKFCRFDPETGEEVVLIDVPFKEAMVYQDKIFYTGEKNGLYSMSLSGSDQKELTSSQCSKLMQYNDKILFVSNVLGVKCLKAIELDGENETLLKEWNALEVAIYEDTLYYIDTEETSDIYYIDLKDEKLEEHRMGLTQGVQDKMHAYAGEQIYDIVSKYMGFDNDPICPAECTHLSAMNGYLLFDSGYMISNEQYRMMYAYHLETGELVLLNHHFEISTIWENILW